MVIWGESGRPIGRCGLSAIKVPLNGRLFRSGRSLGCPPVQSTADAGLLAAGRPHYAVARGLLVAHGRQKPTSLLALRTKIPRVRAHVAANSRAWGTCAI